MHFSLNGVCITLLSFCMGLWLFSHTAHAALVASYNFDTGSGTTTVDQSGNGHTGTITAATWTTSGHASNALLFPGAGSGSRVDIGNATDLNITGSMTTMAWIYITGNPGDDATIVSKRNFAGSAGFQLDTTVDTGPRTIGFKLANASGALMARFGSTTLAINTWYHVAGVYDASAQTLTVYLNGTVNNGTLTGTITTTQLSSTNTVMIGQRPGNLTTFGFQGRIDDVRLYNHALSATEIVTDMNTPVSSGAVPPKVGGLTIQWSQAYTLPLTLEWDYPLLSQQAVPLTNGVFEVYRDTANLVATIAYIDDQTTFTAQDATASSGNHCWKVRAFLDPDASDYSNEVCADVQ